MNLIDCVLLVTRTRIISYYVILMRARDLMTRFVRLYFNYFDYHSSLYMMLSISDKELDSLL